MKTDLLLRLCFVTLFFTVVLSVGGAEVESEDDTVNSKDDSFLKESVFSVDKNDQRLGIIEKFRECLIQMRTEGVIENVVYCPTEFDKIMCWPRTPPNTFLVQTCPSYIDGFVNRNASRFCTSNGTWDKNGRNTSWTNYTGCLRRTSEVGKRHFHIIRTIGHIGYAVSALSLASAILIMIYFKRLHCPRNTIHINLFFAFLLRCIANFASLGVDDQKEDWECKAFFTFQTFTIICSYTWVSIEAIYLHNVILIHVMTQENYSQLLFYILAGWLTPFLVSLTWALLRLFYDDSYCWNRRQQDYYNRAYWLTSSFSIILILTNLIMFINVIRVLFVKMRHEPTADRYRKLARSTLVLVVVFGIYYIVFIPLDCLEAYNTRSMSLQLNLAKLYYQHTLATFQGFLIALLYCFVNGEVLNEIRRRISRYKMMRETRAMCSTHIEEQQVQLASHCASGNRRYRLSSGARRQCNIDSNDAEGELMNNNDNGCITETPIKVAQVS